MNYQISGLIKSCYLVHQLEDELTKPFGWLRFKEKKECKKLKSQIEEKIKSLDNDKWTIDYLYSLEFAIITYYDELKKYMNEDIIPSYDPDVKYDPKRFYSMYFRDPKNNMIILDIISDNIEFTIFDSVVGNSLNIASKFECQKSQKKVEYVCKQFIIDLLTRYLNREMIKENE